MSNCTGYPNDKQEACCAETIRVDTEEEQRNWDRAIAHQQLKQGNKAAHTPSMTYGALVGGIKRDP